MQLQIGVKVIIRNSDNKYLFIQRTELLQNENELSWDIPGGRIDITERLEDALVREVKEELNIELSGTTKLLNAQDIFVEKKQLHVVRLTYLAEQNINSGLIKLSDEHQAFAWYDLQDIKSINIDPYLLKTLELL